MRIGRSGAALLLALVAIAVAALAVVGSTRGQIAASNSSPAGTTSAATAANAATAPTAPTWKQLIGQKLVITFSGTTPSEALLIRIRHGEIGGVCLLGSNITSRSQLIALTGSLQAAARDGGQPPLLIAVDQEGGSVKRISWAPPTISPPKMGEMDSTSVARSQGSKTGAALGRLGINVDFAPVADIPRSTASFMYQQGRTFGFDAAETARLADAFASGLESQGAVATMKHFPGLGLAKRNTDLYADTISASRTTLSTDLRPYRTAVGHDIPMIMLSNATYTAYDPSNAAGWSSAIGITLLRHELGFTGVTITDSLSGAATSRGLTVKSLALRAAIAGTDMILMNNSEAMTQNVYTKLLTEARNGSIPLATLRASYNRILALKAGL